MGSHHIQAHIAANEALPGPKRFEKVLVTEHFEGQGSP